MMAQQGESIQFDTRKTVQEIANVLRSYGGNMEKLNSDPLAGISGGETEAIAIVIWDEVRGFREMMKHPASKGAAWAVQVYVYEQGEARHIELVALGKSSGSMWLSGAIGRGNRTYHLGFSRDHRDELAKLLA